MKKLFVFVLIALFAGVGFSGLVIAEEGVTDTEIVLAGHMDCSGPIAAWGLMLKNGLELAAKEINEAGGIHGRNIRLVIEDSQYDPKKAIMVTNKIINMDKPFAFICNMGSACGIATRKIIERKKIPQLFPMSASRKLFEPFNLYTFGGATDTYCEGRAMMKYFVEDKKYKKIGFFCQDDEMGESLIRSATDQLATYNLKPVAVERYKRGDTEFSSQIAKLKKADVQLVALGTVLRETVGAWKEAKKIGWKVDMCTLKQSCNFYVPLLCKKAGVSPEGLYSTVMCHFPHENSKLPYVSNFYKRYRKVYKQPADGPAFSGPIALHYVEVALKKVGSDLTREKFVDALETFDNYAAEKIGMVPLTYTKKDHTGMTGVYIVQFHEGLYRTVSDGVIDFRK